MSDAVTVTHERVVSTVTLNVPPFNVLDIDTIDALVDAHQEADANPETKVMLTRSAIDGMFCNGLNPLFVLERDDAGRGDVFRAVGRLCKALYQLTKPHIAVINGPAMAGGAVLAMLADYRYFDQDRGRISFAEAKVGLPIPAALQRIIGAVSQPAWLRNIILLGQTLDARQACDAGLADGCAPATDLDALVDKQVQRFARLSLAVTRANKTALRADVLASVEAMASGDATQELAAFVGNDFLGEGLQAFMEGRHPVFKK